MMPGILNRHTTLRSNTAHLRRFPVRPDLRLCSAIPLGRLMVPRSRLLAGLSGPLRPHAAPLASLRDADAFHRFPEVFATLRPPAMFCHPSGIFFIPPRRPNTPPASQRDARTLPWVAARSAVADPFSRRRPSESPASPRIPAGCPNFAVGRCPVRGRRPFLQAATLRITRIHPHPSGMPELCRGSPPGPRSQTHAPGGDPRKRAPLSAWPDGCCKGRMEKGKPARLAP
jgi:hypothetical protein